MYHSRYQSAFFALQPRRLPAGIRRSTSKNPVNGDHDLLEADLTPPAIAPRALIEQLGFA